MDQKLAHFDDYALHKRRDCGSVAAWIWDGFTGSGLGSSGPAEPQSLGLSTVTTRVGSSGDARCVPCTP